MKCIKLVLSCYACEPNRGSEPGVGWAWALGMAKRHETYVLTRANNRDVIEAELARLNLPPSETPNFIYVDLSPLACRLKKRGIIPVSLYYLLWQFKARKMLDSLHRNGFRVVVSQDPVVSVANASQWGEADKLGFFTVDCRTGKSYDMPWPWGGNCGVVDFTNPAACSWWGAYQQKAIDDGVDGFWTDMGEPAWSNEESTDRLFQQHSIGSHDAVHNVYGLYWDKAVTEQFEERNPNKRLFQMTRSAFAGMQRYAFSWTGDSGSATAMRDSWEQFAAQIPMMLSAGMGGIPFITGDITGYCGEIDDYAEVAELYVRWLQFGLFTPLSRAHHEGNTAVEPWQFGLEAEQCARKAIELKYKLLPYIYTTSRED